MWYPNQSISVVSPSHCVGGAFCGGSSVYVGIAREGQHSKMITLKRNHFTTRFARPLGPAVLGVQAKGEGAVPFLPWDPLSPIWACLIGMHMRGCLWQPCVVMPSGISDRTASRGPRHASHFPSGPPSSDQRIASHCSTWTPPPGHPHQREARIFAAMHSVAPPSRQS